MCDINIQNPPFKTRVFGVYLSHYLMLKRIEDIERWDADTKKHLFFLIDNVIQNFITKKAFA